MCYGAFRTYMQPFLTEIVMMSLPFLPFKGHIFNIMLLPAYTFYIPTWLRFWRNRIRKTKDFQNILFRIFMNLLENRDTSIEDMTQHYLHLSTYLEDACENRNRKHIEVLILENPEIKTQYVNSGYQGIRSLFN